MHIWDCFDSPFALLGASAHPNDIFGTFYEAIKIIWGKKYCSLYILSELNDRSDEQAMDWEPDKEEITIKKSDTYQYYRD